MDFLVNLINNILADIILWLGFGLLVYLFIRIVRSKFLKFFGLETNRKLVVYLSNLWKPTTEKPEGYVLSEHEFRAAESINSLFGSTPLRFPELVRGLVDSFWIGKELDITTTVSPLPTDGITFTNMIVVGGTPRNNVRRHYLSTGAPYLAIAGEQIGTPANALAPPLTPSVRIRKGHRKDEVITGDYNFAIVEKIHDDEHRTVVFMCVGFRGDSSWAATEYLVRHWSELSKKYGDKAFALCLGFPKSEVYMKDYKEPITLASFPSYLA